MDKDNKIKFNEIINIIPGKTIKFIDKENGKKEEYQWEEFEFQNIGKNCCSVSQIKNFIINQLNRIENDDNVYIFTDSITNIKAVLGFYQKKIFKAKEFLESLINYVKEDYNYPEDQELSILSTGNGFEVRTYDGKRGLYKNVKLYNINYNPIVSSFIKLSEKELNFLKNKIGKDKDSNIFLDDLINLKILEIDKNEISSLIWKFIESKTNGWVKDMEDGTCPLIKIIEKLKHLTIDVDDLYFSGRNNGWLHLGLKLKFYMEDYEKFEYFDELNFNTYNYYLDLEEYYGDICKIFGINFVNEGNKGFDKWLGDLWKEMGKISKYLDDYIKKLETIDVVNFLSETFSIPSNIKNYLKNNIK